MLEKEVFRIRRDAEQSTTGVHAATAAATLIKEPPRAKAATPLSPSAKNLPMTCTAAREACAADGGDALKGEPYYTAASGTPKESPSQRTSSLKRRTSPREPTSNASPSSSPHEHVLAERAATSFRQDRRLQRGRIGSFRLKLPDDHDRSDTPTSSLRAPVPVSPKWTGLPDSVLHAPRSPRCPLVPSSDTSVSDTEHATATTEVRQPLSLPVNAAVSAGDRANTSASLNQNSALTAEDDEGDVEYKWRLTGISATRFQHLVTQMQFRVSEGRGQCLYELGVSDDGIPRGLTRRDFDESVQTVQRMAAQLQLEATLLQCCSVPKAKSTTTDVKKISKRDITRRTCTSNTLVEKANNAKVDREEEEEELLCGEIMVSRRQSSNAHDLSVAFCGAVGCGKSTLMAVLLTARLDDGCGGTRQSLFNHKHELNSGRTSSLASRVWTVPQDGADADAYTARGYTSPIPPLPPSAVPVPSGFQSSWSPVPSPAVSAVPPTPPFTCASPRSITLLDAGGDITKTMLFGLMSRKPDYVCVCVAADTSDVSDVPLYAEVCCAMNTPFVVAVTKCDCVAEFELDGLIMELTVALEKMGCEVEQVESMVTTAAYCNDWLPRHREAAVDGGGAYAHFASPTTSTAHGLPATASDNASAAAGVATGRLRVPVFCVSSVEGGKGLDFFRSCLSHLQNPPPSPPLSPPSCLSQPPFEVLLDSAFDVDDVGPVVHGRVAHGPVEVGCTCYIGPGSDGRFYSVLVRGIHVDGEHVNIAKLGDEATFALDRLPKAVTVSHKGKVLVRQPERVTMRFEAAVQVLSQSIGAHMEPIMYTRNARQAVTVESVNAAAEQGREAPYNLAAELASAASQEVHRECTVKCRFLFRPEVVGPGDAVVLHWAPRGIAVGRIVAVEAPPQPRGGDSID